MNICYRKFAGIAFFLMLVPVIAQAVVVPSAMLEKGATYALGDSVYGFRVPTVNSLGQINYYDLVIDLNVNTAGTISPTANVVATKSLVIPTTGVMVPGTYRATGGSTTNTCTVTNITLTNGRIQSYFSCNNGYGTLFESSLVTGPITSGHPYLATLLSNGINTLTDVSTQTWGIITSGSLYLGACGGISRGQAIGAKTNGSKIFISVFNGNTFYCGNALNKL